MAFSCIHNKQKLFIESSWPFFLPYSSVAYAFEEESSPFCASRNAPTSKQNLQSRLKTKETLFLSKAKKRVRKYLHFWPSPLLTLFENYSKCRIWIFEFWHFPPIFFLLKLTCLVTLFDRKLQFFRNSFWGFLINFCPFKM